MAIEQLDRIDGIGIDNNSGDVVLVILDDLNWDKEEYHLSLIHQKVEAYLGFLERGEIFNSYPDAEGRSIVIKIYGRYPATIAGIRSIERLAEDVFDQGFRLAYQKL